jgi:GNAT superfamily N-acetyltransferase
MQLGSGLRQVDRGGSVGAVPRQPAVRPAEVFSEGIDGMKITTTYLQMFAHPERLVPPPRESIAVVHAKKPPVAYYRFLYDAVGRDYDWTSRKKLTDAALAAIIHDPRDEVHVLMAGGVPAGFAELDRRVEGEIELVQFGLMPEFVGQGLGRYFLQWTIDKAWSYKPRRFWLHTCTKDHPAALPNYLKAGFAIYKEGINEKEDM